MSAYTWTLATIGLSSLLREAMLLERTLIADGTPNQAALVAKAAADLEAELNVIAARTAGHAEATIKRQELQTRVRPDTGGGGGPRLGDFIGTSHPLPTVPGSVGINHEPTLDANGVEWWRTQEKGYSGHIGRTFIGAFDGTRPEAQYALGPPGGPHALLKIGKSAGGNRGKGTIRRPIPERRFVRDGGGIAAARWHKEVRAAKAKFMAEITSATVSSAQQRKRDAARRAARRRP